MNQRQVGQLSFIVDPILLEQARYVSKVIYVGSNCPQVDNVIQASILLPPFNIMTLNIDGDHESFSHYYLDYLINNKDCFEYFCTILIALYNGVNVTIFVEEATMNTGLTHGLVLEYFIESYLGINSIQNGGMNQTIIPGFERQHAKMLFGYLDGFITSEEFAYMMNYDANLVVSQEMIPLSNSVINKILAQVGVQMIYGNDLSPIQLYLNNIKAFGNSYELNAPNPMTSGSRELFRQV